VNHSFSEDPYHISENIELLLRFKAYSKFKTMGDDQHY